MLAKIIATSALFAVLASPAYALDFDTVKQKTKTVVLFPIRLFGKGCGVVAGAFFYSFFRELEGQDD